MLDQDELNKIQSEDMKKLGKINTKADEIVAKAVDEIQRRCQILRDKIKELIDKKSVMLRSPRSKPEVLELAKEALRKNRKDLFLDGVLVSHLKDAQNQHDIALHPDSVRMGICGGRNFWKLAYCIITEEDIEEAVKALPDIGLSENERDAQVKKIDEEIANLESQVEKELKKP
jgi:hypothetical protein